MSVTRVVVALAAAVFLAGFFAPRVSAVEETSPRVFEVILRDCNGQLTDPPELHCYLLYPPDYNPITVPEKAHTTTQEYRVHGVDIEWTHTVYAELAHETFRYGVSKGYLGDKESPHQYTPQEFPGEFWRPLPEGSFYNAARSLNAPHTVTKYETGQWSTHAWPRIIRDEGMGTRIYDYEGPWTGDTHIWQVRLAPEE